MTDESNLCALGGDGQTDAATFDQRVVVAAVVTNGEIVADWYGIVLQVFVQHVIHVSKVILRLLVFGEMADDDALQLRQNASDFQLMQHTVHLGHSLAGVLNEEYQALVGATEEIIVGACQSAQDGEVAAHQDSLGLTRLIQRMGRDLVAGQLALQQSAQDGIHRVATLAFGGNAVAHSAVDAHHAGADGRTMRRRRRHDCTE